MCSSQAEEERAAVCMGKFHSTEAVCAVGPHNTPNFTQLLNGVLNGWCRSEMSVYLSYQNNTIWSYEASDVINLLWSLVLCKGKRPLWWARWNIWELIFGRSTGRSTPSYWHLVVKNGNLTFLLVELILADQVADLPHC